MSGNAAYHRELEPCDCGSAQENHGWACRCDNPPSKRSAAIERRSVFFEETDEERFITGYCQVCRTDPDDFPYGVVVSPTGVCHTQGDDGMETMRCGANGAADGWWWHL